MADEKLLSYGDVLLRKSDLELLRGPCYLNDRVIEFFFAYLSSELPSSILLVPPAITFWILHCPHSDGLHSSIDPLDLLQRKVVMFPINNNEDVELVGGGTHWSLLVYYRNHNGFEHYDSMGGTNSRTAKRFLSMIKPFMGSEVASAKLEQPQSPQQENDYDCGVYVMATVQALCQAYVDGLKGSLDHTILVGKQVTPRTVSDMRHNVSDLILSLSSKQNRS